MQNKDELFKMRHSAEHVLHQAVKELFPQILLAMGPATESGFYFDFDNSPNGVEPVSITEKDFGKIEKRMKEIINKDLPITREEISVEEAKSLFGDNPYKLVWINEAEKRGDKISIYWTGKPNEKGSMVDLCAGPHANSTGEIKSFKLLSVAGAYWRGDEKNKMLTRIYGTAFFTKEELDNHLKMMTEAKKRDHRKLGADLDLFFIDELVGKGLIMWLPKGTILRDQIEKLVKTKEEEYGYVRVVTPHIAREELFMTSGHLPYYKDSMYPPMVMDDGTYYLKAMNCPHHHRIFLQKPKSYREMPIRIAEYGTCYRNELSGTLAGLLRVRCMSMNDAHIYCRKDQIEEEFTSVLNLTQEYFKIFGLSNYWFRLSKWDSKNKDKYIDELENWEYSEDILRKVLTKLNLPFKEVDNEAAFYGPKVDVQFTSAIGREETMSTIQLDFAAKKRFNLKFTDVDGKVNNEVFVIHRAPLSVHERFTAFLIEHYAGAFPLWLAPVQIALLPIGEAHIEYAQKVQKALQFSNIRVEVDTDAKSIGAKIRHHTLQKVPYMGIIGDKEIESKSISLRSRDGKDHGAVEVEALVKKFVSEIENHT